MTKQKLFVVTCIDREDFDTSVWGIYQTKDQAIAGAKHTLCDEIGFEKEDIDARWDNFENSFLGNEGDFKVMVVEGKLNA